MRIKRGQASIKLPPVDHIIQAVIDERRTGGHAFVLMLVHPEVFQEELKKSKRYYGRPTACAVLGDRLYFRPAADQPYELRVRYAPPIEEL